MTGRLPLLLAVCWLVPGLDSFASAAGSAAAQPAATDSQPAEAAVLPAATRIQVQPQTVELSGPLELVQLVVSGENSTDQAFDLTRDSSYQVEPEGVVSVSPAGRVTPLANGEATITVLSGELQAVVPVKVIGFEASPGVSFRNDVVPVLSRAGCGGGACHASQYGKGGFKLSLLGFDPASDYEPIVRDRRQRRVSLLRPEDSLILRKATMQVGHGGGKRFDEDSHSYRVLLRWIEAGVPPLAKTEPIVNGLEVFPTSRVYQPGQLQQLRVVASYSDGSTRDVTAACMYDSLGDGVAQVTAEGLVNTVGRGQAAVMIRYMGQARLTHVLVPFADSVDLTGFEPANFVDENVLLLWKRLGVSPVERCDDATFIRRAFLDALGTLPKPEHVREFLASTDPEKRVKLVDELLGLTGDPKRDRFEKEWSAWWTLKWGDLIRTNRNKLGAGGMWAFTNWMRTQFRENRPMDEFVREIITAQGSIYENGPANYYRIATTPEDLAEATAQVFLGVRMQCARCHHHPFEVYSQQDYYGLAAFFTRVTTKPSVQFGALGGDSVVRLKRSGSVKHPRSRKVVPPTPLLGEPIDESQVRDLRRPLAEWITSPENDLFARNVVNRMWGYLMGTGLVEPIDDMRATNPPSNPELLDALAKFFVESGYDLRQLTRAIMTSEVYQRSSQPTEQHAASTRLYLHYNVKRMGAEALL
ncbi:MAG: DUF1549 domain-containing protein, partial [Planctomycetaceae bacterium]|nr:DUF1549 domain-containing protein [Planctomycetaceae bacterium]